MLFTVYEDSGDCIKAYCVPDDYTSQSQLVAFQNGKSIATIGPNDFNGHMAGRHETGHVGFIIDNRVIPDIAIIGDLELRDRQTDILVYRRPNPTVYIQRSIFRLETHLFPLWRLDAALKDRFRFWYQRIEQFSAETVRQILSFHTFGSLYSSGRILYQNYDYYLRDNQSKVVVVQDPYHELAERLIVLNRLSAESALTLLGERDALIFESALTTAKGFINFDEQEIKKVLRNADPDVLFSLSNPLTRQLTASTPDETVGKNSVAQALRCLSEFEIIGQRQEVDDFISALWELMNSPDPSIKIPDENPEIRSVAENLRSISWIESILEKDLEIYHYIKTAYDALPAKV